MKKATIVTSLCVAVFSAAFAFFIFSASSIVIKNQTDDVRNTKSVQRNWLMMLNLQKPDLHDAIVAAMLASKSSGKEVFVLKEDAPLSKLSYKLSFIRGGADNLLSYTHDERLFSFDHYNEKTGPTLAMAENAMYINNKIINYYAELGIK